MLLLKALSKGHLKFLCLRRELQKQKTKLSWGRLGIKEGFVLIWQALAGYPFFQYDFCFCYWKGWDTAFWGCIGVDAWERDFLCSQEDLGFVSLYDE